jgi:hypothetical protein
MSTKCRISKGYVKNGKKFSARIMLNGARICLGQFETPEQARSAYTAAKTTAGESIPRQPAH